VEGIDEELKLFERGTIHCRVIEWWLHEDRTWRFKRLKDDKVKGKHIRKAMETVSAVRGNVSKQELVDTCTAEPDGRDKGFKKG
jgi:hypothetical protein